MRLALLLLLVSPALAAAAPAPGPAPADGFLGWTDDGTAIAAYAVCYDGRGWCGDLVVIADDTGDRALELPRAFVSRPLTRVADTAPLWIERRPVQVDVARVAHRDAADTIELVVRAGARVLERRVVTDDGGDNDGISAVTFEVHPSPDGARVAVEIAYMEKVAEWRNPVHRLYVLGPPPTSPPPAVRDARDDIVELRHGRPFVPRLVGFTAGGAAIVRDRACDGSDCAIALRAAAADGTTAALEVARTSDAPLPYELAARWLAAERDAAIVLGPLAPVRPGPARCGGQRARVDAAIADDAHVALTLRAGAARRTAAVAIADDLDPDRATPPASVRVAAVAPAADDDHVVALLAIDGATRPFVLACPAP